MLDYLSKYKHADHLFFSTSDNFGQVCNAPADKSGVYVIYALKNGRIELIYIGRSGEVNLMAHFSFAKQDWADLKTDW